MADNGYVGQAKRVGDGRTDAAAAAGDKNMDHRRRLARRVAKGKSRSCAYSATLAMKSPARLLSAFSST